MALRRSDSGWWATETVVVEVAADALSQVPPVQFLTIVGLITPVAGIGHGPPFIDLSMDATAPTSFRNFQISPVVTAP
jgi:hypothetical protein